MTLKKLLLNPLTIQPQKKSQQHQINQAFALT
jgi:hypothetical protein